VYSIASATFRSSSKDEKMKLQERDQHYFSKEQQSGCKRKYE